MRETFLRAELSLIDQTWFSSSFQNKRNSDWQKLLCSANGLLIWGTVYDRRKLAIVCSGKDIVSLSCALRPLSLSLGYTAKEARTGNTVKGRGTRRERNNGDKIATGTISRDLATGMSRNFHRTLSCGPYSSRLTRKRNWFVIPFPIYLSQCDSTKNLRLHLGWRVKPVRPREFDGSLSLETQVNVGGVSYAISPGRR